MPVPDLGPAAGHVAQVQRPRHPRRLLVLGYVSSMAPDPFSPQYLHIGLPGGMRRVASLLLKAVLSL